VHSICSLFHFLYNQLPMKIVFASFYKTYFKDNTKNYVTSYYVLVFLISVIFFFLLIIWDGGSIFFFKDIVVYLCHAILLRLFNLYFFRNLIFVISLNALLTFKNYGKLRHYKIIIIYRNNYMRFYETMSVILMLYTNVRLIFFFSLKVKLVRLAPSILWIGQVWEKSLLIFLFIFYKRWMRYALIMAVTINRCFKIPTMVKLQNIVCQMLIAQVEQNPTKLSKTIIDIPNFI